MVETTLAAADLITAVPALWESLKVPLSILLIIGGVVACIINIHRGIGAAAGKLIGAIALAAVVLGAVGLTASGKTTLDRHCNGCTVGQYGQ